MHKAKTVSVKITFITLVNNYLVIFDFDSQVELNVLNKHSPIAIGRRIDKNVVFIVNKSETAILLFVLHTITTSEDARVAVVGTKIHTKSTTYCCCFETAELIIPKKME